MVTVPSENVIHKNIIVDDAGVLPIQSPKLIMHDPHILQLRPLLMHGKRESEPAFRHRVCLQDTASSSCISLRHGRQDLPGTGAALFMAMHVGDAPLSASGPLHEHLYLDAHVHS